MLVRHEEYALCARKVGSSVALVACMPFLRGRLLPSTDQVSRDHVAASFIPVRLRPILRVQASKSRITVILAKLPGTEAEHHSIIQTFVKTSHQDADISSQPGINHV